MQAKGEFEYVGKKVVGNGCNESSPNDLTSYCLGAPNKEFRLALASSFLEGKINVGLNMMIASGYTGQTTENFATNYATRVSWALSRCSPEPTLLQRWLGCAYLRTRA